MIRTMIIRAASAFSAFAFFTTSGIPAHAAELEISTVLSRAIADNPQLAAYDSGRREAEARATQARLLPNPSLSTDIENIAGSGEFEGTDEAETTIMLSQDFELGGKRGRRRRAAELDTEVAARDYDGARAAVLREASVAFVDVLAEQKLLALVDEEIELANQVLAGVKRRVEAGSLSRVELARAEIAHSRARLERTNRVRALSGARLRLAATWGSIDPDFDRVVGTFDLTLEIPNLDTLREQLVSNPELVRWTTEFERREALVELERSRAIPDVTIGAGYRRLSGPNDDAMVAQFSLPLPLFDRNQGGIEEARAGALRAESERRSTEVRLLTELARSVAIVAAAREESATLEEVILPHQSRTFENLRSGFREGRFNYLEVLDAQRTLVETRSQRVRALADYHQAVATIQWLTGRPLTAGLQEARSEQGSPQ